MTIDRAIQILNIVSAHIGVIPDQDFIDAAKLGIEALKRVKEARKKVYFTSRSLLLGETKD